MSAANSFIARRAKRNYFIDCLVIVLEASKSNSKRFSVVRWGKVCANCFQLVCERFVHHVHEVIVRLSISKKCPKIFSFWLKISLQKDAKFSEKYCF